MDVKVIEWARALTKRLKKIWFPTVLFLSFAYFIFLIYLLLYDLYIEYKVKASYN